MNHMHFFGSKHEVISENCSFHCGMLLAAPCTYSNLAEV